MLTWLIFIAGAYLIGSIPVGFLIGRAKGIDIRQHGSRNVGATNVVRVLGRPLGILCFFLDMAKGAGPVVVAGATHGLVSQSFQDISHVEMSWWLAVAAASILGHMYSIFLRFGGGKGVATGFGALLGMWPLLTIPAVMAVVVWYTMLRLTRYVSLASIAAALSLPFWTVVCSVPGDFQVKAASETFNRVLHAWPLVLVTGLLGLVVLWKHRGNLARIRRGEEPKVGRRASRGDVLSTDPAQPRARSSGGRSEHGR